MAKRNNKIKQQLVKQGNNKGIQIEHSESFDDSFVTPEELAKYKELDPSMIEWLKKRHEKEQDARLKFNGQRVNLIKSGQTKSFIVDLTSLILAFIIALSGMYISLYLLIKGNVLEGTIFGGVTLFLIIRSFLNFRKIKIKDE